MKIKNVISILAMMPYLCGCLDEYHEATPDRDSDKVILNVEITGDMSVDDEGFSYEDTYMHRITVAAYKDNCLAVTKTVYEKPTENGAVNASVSLSCDAEEYDIVVWADMLMDNVAYYDIDDLVGVRPIWYTDDSSAYGMFENVEGCTVCKDALYASFPINLTSHKNGTGAHETISLSLARPMGKYEIVATDVEKFLAGSKPSPENPYKVRLVYGKHIPVGFNALNGITKYAHDNVFVNRVIDHVPADSKTFSMISDYIFMDKESDTVPATVEVLDSSDEIVARSSIYIELEKNSKTSVTGKFLTSRFEGGIGIDAEFDTKDDIDLGAI